MLDAAFRVSPRGQLHEGCIVVKAGCRPVALLPLQALQHVACAPQPAGGVEHGASEVALKQQVCRRRVATVTQLLRPVLEIEVGVSIKSGQSVVVVGHHRIFALRVALSVQPSWSL